MNTYTTTQPTPVLPVEPQTAPSIPPTEPAQPFVTPSEPKIEPCPRVPDGDEGFPKCQFGTRLRELVD